VFLGTRTAGISVNSPPLRCFLGLPLPPDIREILAEKTEGWRRAGLRGSWVKPANFHVTVRFLGNLNPAQIEQLQTLSRELPARCGPLQLRIAEAGVFPNQRRPSVFWAGLRAEAGDLDAVFQAAETAARAMGLTPERRLPHPHVTLARFRQNPPPERLQKILDEALSLKTDVFSIRSVALWKSDLKPGGAVYEQLAEFTLLR